MKKNNVVVRSILGTFILLVCIGVFNLYKENYEITLKNNGYIHQIHNLESEKVNLQNDIAELESEVANLQRDIETLKKENEKKCQSHDGEYKIFYGEWEITEFMGRSRYCYGEEQEYFIGRHIYYDEDKIEIDGQVVMEEPVYMCGLIPCKYWYIYTWVYPANTESIDLVWGRQEDFFAHVHVKQYFDGESTIMSYGNTFYIVDEDTLVLDTDDGWYKMERLSYIEGYPESIRL